MTLKVWATLALAAVTSHALLVACGSSDKAIAKGAGGEAGGEQVGSAGEGGADASNAGGGSAVAGGAGGAPSAGDGGASATPNAGAGLGGAATNGDAGSGAGGESTGSLVQGHCYYVSNGYCIEWGGLPQNGDDVLSGECASDQADATTPCFVGFYGKCVTPGPNGAFINEHYYETLGGASREELEPQSKAACEGDSGTWVSTP